MRDYVKELGYKPARDALHGEVVKGRVECEACGREMTAEGNVMRGHRRRCPVNPGNPYTPARAEA